MKLLYDTLSSERGPETVVHAAVKARNTLQIDVSLVGNKTVLNSILEKLSEDPENYSIIHCNDSICMSDYAPDACRQNQQASINIAMQKINEGQVDGVISPGHTGATVFSAKETLGRIGPVERPGLCQVIPVAGNKQILMIDVGATITREPIDLLYFGYMAREYFRTIFDKETVNIGFLNIGSEPGKGSLEMIETHNLLAQHLPEFIGNIEGHDIWTGKADIVLTNGITGNIVLKASEGLLRLLYASCKGRDFQRHLEPSDYGGAVLLGVKGLCIVCHGTASQREMVSASAMAKKCFEKDIIKQISRTLNCLENQTH